MSNHKASGTNVGLSVRDNRLLKCLPDITRLRSQDFVILVGTVGKTVSIRAYEPASSHYEDVLRSMIDSESLPLVKIGQSSI